MKGNATTSPRSRGVIVYRVTFHTSDGARLPTAFFSKPDALTGIARGLASGRYVRAVMTKARLGKGRWGRETVLAIEIFEPTQRAA